MPQVYRSDLQKVYENIVNESHDIKLKLMLLNNHMKETQCCKAIHKEYEDVNSKITKVICTGCGNPCTLEDVPTLKFSYDNTPYTMVTTPTQTEGWEVKVLERFSEMEHIRWAKWQNYMHSFLTWNNALQAWVLPHEKKVRWQSQIETTYAFLSDKEKDSDREQVKPYLDFIKSERELWENELVEKIKELTHTRILSIESSQAGKNKTLGYHKALKEVINLIKNK